MNLKCFFLQVQAEKFKNPLHERQQVSQRVQPRKTSRLDHAYNKVTGYLSVCVCVCVQKDLANH